jgi:hypothetical protein
VDDVLEEVMKEAVLLNGRRPLDWQLPAVWRGYARLRLQGREQLGGLLSEYPRQAEPGGRPRHVTDIEVDFATARRRP